jgi:ADP-heptose:LPS heptosyltransferase
MGSIESNKSDSLIKIASASDIPPKRQNIAPLQHRSVAFNMLTDLAVSELCFKEKISFVIDSSKSKDKKRDFVIGVGLGANSNARKWPIDYYISLIQKIIQHDNILINIYGAGADDEKDSELVRLACRSSKVRNYVNKFNLDDTMNHMKEVDLFIGNNSGLGHLSAYVNVPSVIIFSGANESDRWSPKSNTMLISKNVSCSPCDISLRSACPNNMKCLDGISPTEVFERISNLIPSLFNSNL